MSTFYPSLVQRWPRVKIVTLAKECGYPRGAKVTKELVLEWLRERAQSSESANQVIWDTYQRLKGGPIPSGMDENRVRQISREVTDACVTQALTPVNDLVRHVERKIDEHKVSASLDENDLGQLKKDALAQVDQIVREELKKHRRIEVKAPHRQRARKMSYKLPPVFEDIIQFASQRIHCMMVGPTGSGKTFLGERVAEALSLEFAAISCSAGMSESKLEGSMLPTGKGGAFEYWPSSFVQMYEEGGVFLFDEIDASDPNTLTLINAALAGDRFFVEKRFENPEVVRHEDFICLAAANTWGQGADAQFVGREQLDAATLNRFSVGMVEVGYDQDVERWIVDQEMKDEEQAKQLLAFCWAAREACMTHNIRRAVSTRFIKELAVMVEAYKWPQDKWEQQMFRGWSRTEVSKVREALPNNQGSFGRLQ